MQTIYDEKEYEFNERLVLKKIASFFVTLATTREPEKNSDLLEILQKWHDGQLIDAPTEYPLQVLMDLAYEVIKSLKNGDSDLIPIS